jgi:hypothetical protein
MYVIFTKSGRYDGAHGSSGVVEELARRAVAWALMPLTPSADTWADVGEWAGGGSQ